MEKWYPGHITEAKRELIDNLKMCDTVIEVVDARSPFASKNRELDKFIKGKNRILIINKSDLIEEKISINLEKNFKKKYRYVAAISAKSGKNMKRLLYILEAMFRKKKEKLQRRGVNAFPIRVVVLGVPNVGKSQIINKLIGRKVAGVANKPGFTRGKQWVRILPNVDLLDTPGILWTNSSENELKKMALIGSLKDSFHNTMGAAIHLIEIISKRGIEKAYQVVLTKEEPESVIEELTNIWKKSEEDVYKKLITDFRKGKLGLISLESA
ncbi:MAG TPA: ribosome biogenesis GTPase YlqF [Fusobacteria bacterium]|nr:ribosome biogenesis GTPase YlqF [Fusobacteriota bacterium]|tara:strand:- start:6257 stop:7063 length:807 start_codon:yes stop_codon:yes gene_type:complete